MTNCAGYTKLSGEGENTIDNAPLSRPPRRPYSPNASEHRCDKERENHDVSRISFFSLAHNRGCITPLPPHRIISPTRRIRPTSRLASSLISFALSFFFQYPSPRISVT